jgi:imidazolonepropionase
MLIQNAAEVFDGEAILDADAVLIEDGRIAWIGRGTPPGDVSSHAVVDASGALITPGLVECHTHLVFAGDRADEYAMRAAGAGYLEIAAAGGGIAKTMRATRAASLDQLCALARPRLDRLLSFGVTTAEVKSGYGLDTATELKMLRTVRHLHGAHPIDLVGTFLGAHTVPPEWKPDRVGYLDVVINEMLPAVAEEGLAEFCDIFVEQGVFTLADAERLFEAGLAHGLRPKVHAEQLSCNHGAGLAAQMGAVSADHLEHLDEAGVAALAKAGTVAVLLPGASVFLGDDHRPPTAALREAGVPIALSTDCNPGTCMTENLLLMLTLGMSRLGMTPIEVLQAVTSRAAQAIGREEIAGRLAVGRAADIAVFDVPSHQHLPYHFAVPCTRAVFKAGRRVL